MWDRNDVRSLWLTVLILHYSDWVCTAVMSKWRHERSSRLIRNLSNCEREAWKKNSGFSGIQTRDLCDTGAVLYQLSYEAITVGSRSVAHSSVGRALHRYRRGHGFESRWSLNFFQASLSQLLKLRINCEDLSWRHCLNILITVALLLSKYSNLEFSF